jgi:organic radical activating enzyme
MIKINEIFGPTIQGEGAAAGRHCLFVRVALCNLECTWCDTDYTWAFTEEKAAKHRTGVVHNREENLKEMAADHVLEELYDLWDFYDAPTVIVISGGEPMMQQEALMPLLYELSMAGNQVHIETAGTIAPRRNIQFTTISGKRQELNFDGLVTQFNVSPKLSHSGNIVGKRYKPVVLQEFARKLNAWFKFVVTKPSDLIEVDEMILNQQIAPGRVMIMPEGSSVEDNIELARKFADDAISRGYGISFRSHVLLWPKIHRGR